MPLMLDFLEYEEKFGWFWHRLVGDAASYPRFEEHAVSFEQVKGSLPIFFRALGGDPGLELVANTPRHSNHRLTWRQRIGMEQERLDQAERHDERILLPPEIASFPDTGLNRQLYLWLAAFFTCPQDVLGGTPPGDDLQADIMALHRADKVTRLVLASLPGFVATYADLAVWTLHLRPERRLPKAEAAVERVVRALLGEVADGDDDGLLSLVRAETLDLSDIKAPSGYRSFLPVPLWGEVLTRDLDRSMLPKGEKKSAGDAKDESPGKPKRAVRQQPDQLERNDPLALVNKGDLLMLAAEMVNVSRAEDEEKPDAAKKALDDMEQLTLGDSDEKISSPLRMDLDLAARDIEETRATGPITLPEWHYRKAAYLPDYCLIDATPAAEEGEGWAPDRAARQRIRRVRRQFEAFRPGRETRHRQIDGVDLDMDALVRARTDQVATGRLSDKIYLDIQNQARDLAAAVLVDVSLSTDAWVDNCRALDVEKEALTALAHGLDACGDIFGIWSFTSTKRQDVRVARVKDFDEPLGGAPLRRISALKPGAYTRMGAAIRYVQQTLAERSESHRLLLLLSDGKPHDIDHYDGRFGIEDTRKAVQEARHAGTAVFAITIDREASSYVPYLFGQGGYALVSHINRLVPALPAIYRQLVR